MVEPYQTVYDGEIFQQSQCLWHENTLMEFFRTQIAALGYQRCSDSGKIWQRHGRQVIVCVVDDFTTCGSDRSSTIPYLFDTDTVVITDNWISCPTQYRVCQLPTSFFGIYAHDPAPRQWQPDRRFCFVAKRLDYQRMNLMLELQMTSDQQGLPADTDFVNFGCWAWDGDNSSVAGLQSNWDRQFELLDEKLQLIYNHTHHKLRSSMPLLNHDLDLEQSYHGAWINLVVETYSSEMIVTFSEKIFRALTIPVPWMIWCSPMSVARLASLGFDTLTDLVDHRYDSMIERQAAECANKPRTWIIDANEIVTRMKTMSKESLDARLMSAAQHNRKLLQQMRRQWPSDFATWWTNIVQLL